MNYRILFILLFQHIILYSQEEPWRTLPSSPQNITLQRSEKVQHNCSQYPSEKKRTCLFTYIDSLNRIKYSLPSRKEFENAIRKKAEQLKHSSNDSVYIIPVIIHIIHNGESVGTGANIDSSQAYSQLDVLNEDYRKKAGSPGFNNSIVGTDVKIEFALARINPDGKILAEPGINRVNGGKSNWDPEGDEIETTLKPNTQWDPTKYFNIWVVNLGGSSTLGYAQFPNLSNLPGLMNDEGIASTDGVVIRHDVFGRIGELQDDFDMGRTATHEIGHWLGLLHTWGDGDCSVDDYCMDTPLTGYPNYECTKNNSCIEPVNDLDDMIENYMEYTPDACMNIFTLEQKLRIRTVLLNCPRRKELIRSNTHLVNDSTPIANFRSQRQIICKNDSIKFTDISINKPTSRKWFIYKASGELTDSFSTPEVTITFKEACNYDIQLIVSNIHGTDSLYSKEYISVLSDSTRGFPYSDSLSQPFPLKGFTIYNPDGDARKWEISNKVYLSDTQALFFNNYTDTFMTDPSGRVDAIISFPFIGDSLKNAYLTFDVAYAKYNIDYTDTLGVFYIADCQDSIYKILKKGGDDLATAIETTKAFIPDSSQWRREQIYLGNLPDSQKIHLIIANLSGWGNNLYIDNINIFRPAYTQKPLAAFTTAKDTTTLNGRLLFTDQSNHYATFWKWEFENGNPSISYEQNPVVQYQSLGFHDVRLIVGNPSGYDTLILPDYINVIDVPNVRISSSGPGIIQQGESITLYGNGATYYDWYDDRNIVISQEDSIRISPLLSTSYKLRGRDKFGGINYDSITITVLEISETKYDNLNSAVTISPNPAGEYVKITGIRGYQKIYFFQIDGTILCEVILNDKEEVIINTASFSKGLYVIKMLSESHTISKKLILQ